MDNVAVFFALLMLFIFIFRYYLIFLIFYIREKSGIDINNFKYRNLVTSTIVVIMSEKFHFLKRYLKNGTEIMLY